MLSDSPTITQIEDAVLEFLSTQAGRKSKDDIAAGIGTSDLRLVVRALQNLRAQRRVRAFNQGTGSSICTVYDVDPNNNQPQKPSQTVQPQIRQLAKSNPEAPKQPGDSKHSESTPTPSNDAALFSAIDPITRDSINKAFIRIKAKLYELPAPRSLCELRLSRDDYNWLVDWASNVTAATLTEYLNREPWRRTPDLEGFSNREALGTLFLVLAAEAARRESREGSVWPTFVNKFSDAARSTIAFMEGVNSSVRQSIEASAQSLRLRNAFGHTGIQYYYVSIFLQFGITRRGLRQLPYWLTGRTVTETIRYLMEGSSTHSPSFAKFWTLLVDFRNRRVGEDQFRRFLRTTPWVLPEWHDEVCRLAKAQPGDDEDEFDDDYADQLLTEPTLVWSYPDEPHFQFELGNTKALGLNEREYVLRIEGWKDIRLRQSSDRLRPTEPIRIPFSIPQPTLVLLDVNEEEKHRVELELWDPSEEIAIFDISNGKRIDAFEQFIRINRSYAVVTTDDLVPSHSIDKWFRLQKFDKMAWFLAEGWSKDFSFAWSDGELCWQPNLSVGDESGLPFAVKQISVQCDSKRAQIGDAINVSVNAPSSVRIKSLRLAGSRHQLPFENGKIDLPTLTVTPKIAASGFKMAMIVEFEEKKYRVTKAVPITTSGSVRWNGYSWDPVQRETALEADDAQSYTYKLFLPQRIKDNLSDFGIFEGDSFCGRLKRRRQHLGLLSGYGAPLVVKKMFNATQEDDSVEICSAVRNSGILHSATYADNVTIQIDFKRPLDLADKHAVIIWPDDSEPTFLSSEELSQTSESTWQVICPSIRDFIALAIAYDGVRIGAQWPDSIDSFLANASGRIWPGKIAAYLRWMGFPILAARNFDTVRKFAYSYPDDVLAAWLSDYALHTGLNYHNNWSDWLTAVRKLYRNWYPSSPQIANKIIQKLSDSGNQGDLPLVAAKLLSCDPCLMYSVIHEWYRESKDARSIQQCINTVLHLTDTATGNDQVYWQKQCLETAAKTLRVDLRFLENTASTILKELQSVGHLAANTLANIDSLISAAAFRDYLASFLLLSITRTSTGAPNTQQTSNVSSSGTSDAELLKKFVFKESTGLLVVYYAGDKFGSPGKTLRKEFRQPQDAVSFIRRVGAAVREPTIRMNTDGTKKRAYRKNPS
jgi:hypothetical protein